VVPLVSNALIRSTVPGLTIDMRGYRAGNRTHVRERRFQSRDDIVFGVLFVVAGGFATLLLAGAV
jgi:energy-coupling factor transport system permease protein